MVAMNLPYGRGETLLRSRREAIMVAARHQHCKFDRSTLPFLAHQLAGADTSRCRELGKECTDQTVEVHRPNWQMTNELIPQVLFPSQKLTRPQGLEGKIRPATVKCLLLLNVLMSDPLINKRSPSLPPLSLIVAYASVGKPLPKLILLSP